MQSHQAELRRSCLHVCLWHKADIAIELRHVRF
jgi:hypothetical protein